MQCVSTMIVGSIKLIIAANGELKKVRASGGLNCPGCCLDPWIPQYTTGLADTDFGFIS